MCKDQQLSAAVTMPPAREENKEMLVFSSQQNFEMAQRMAKALASSSIVPAIYQNNLSNCLIALEMANRIGMSPLLVMQNLYVVHGNVGWSSKFLIAALNTCGRFSPLRYETENEGDLKNWRCRAWSIDKTTGTPLHGAWVSMQMAKDEGWYDKNGSKWKTMPELMLQYRAAAFFQRAYAPEISMGMQTAEEIYDMSNYETAAPVPPTPPEADGFDISRLRTLEDVNRALLRGHINKEEADGLRETLTKRLAAEDMIRAMEQMKREESRAAAASAPSYGLFSE